MAKVKTAKQRITDYLRAKGYDTADIRDAFDDLDAADADLESVAAQLQDVVAKNAQWVDWYKNANTEFQGVVAERDRLAGILEKMKDAGVEVNLTAGSQKVATKIEDGEYVTPAQFKQFQSELEQRAGAVIKQLTRVSLKHSREYGEEADLDEIEKIVSERGYSVEDAYNQWVAPKREAKSTKDMEEKIAAGIRDGVQAELSKKGVRLARKRPDDVERAPLDKPAPSESELAEAFINDLNAEVTH